MAASLGQIIPERRTGDESLPEGATLLHFWQWMGSDLVSNALRGAFGEYLVALAVGAADKVQEEWAPYDVRSPDGIRIEVKTSGYIQTWQQQTLSTPRFGIGKSYAWNNETGTFSPAPQRSAEVYVFCLHHHKDQDTINPLDLSQWTFYILPTATLDRMAGDQKGIGIGGLERIAAQRVSYDGLCQAIRTAYNEGQSTSNGNTEL